VARDDGSMRELEGLPRQKSIFLGSGATVVEVDEGASRFSHDLLEDAKTGGFLDQRENHLRAGELARGECLDLFSHHGGFALALAGKADRVEAVELDARAAARAAANARLSRRDNVDVRQADAFAVLREHEAAGRRFDVVVVDPPALAKRGGGGPQKGGGAARGPNDAALRAYRELNLRALRITRPGGFLVTCSCSAKMTAPIFGDMLVEAARDSGRSATVVERRGAAGDHPVLLGLPESEYLKCWILQVL
jgi:23S rRNA (cytosine1962-C5)-methyltransferase